MGFFIKVFSLNHFLYAVQEKRLDAVIADFDFESFNDKSSLEESMFLDIDAGL